MFVLATAALLPAGIFREAEKIYRRERPDILMSCERFHTSPFWALTPKPDGCLEPLFPEMVLINSQDLPASVADAGLWYFFNLNTMMKYQSVKIADRLMPFLVPEQYTCDVDTIEDWRVLEEKFERLRTNPLLDGTNSDVKVGEQ